MGLKGINQKAISMLTHYHCPFCYISPIPTLPTAVDVCHVCRNTLTLQQTNSEMEAKLAHEKISNMAKCCNILNNVDFELFHKNLETISQFDAHIRHLLLNQNSLKSLESQIQALCKIIPSSEELKQSPPSTDLQNISDCIQSQEKSFESLQSSISKLQEDLLSFSMSSAPVSSVQSTNSESTNRLLAEISSKLDSICHEETGISAGLSELKQSVAAVRSSTGQIPASQPLPTYPFPPPPPTNVQSPTPEPEPHPHGQSPVSEMIEEFVNDSEVLQLNQFLSTCSFKKEKSHSVASYGTPYDYNGAKSATNVPPIPDALQPLFNKVNELQKKLFHEKYPEHSGMRDPPPAPVINSCLINMYDGPESYLPKHSDREVTISPESSIFTLSLGQSCTIKFVEQSSGAESSHVCSDKSLYHMTRRSQEVFCHSIDKGSISDVRYSLTFRSVDWRNRNSTCLIGDSNTGQLRFGACKRGSFGELMPGQRFWAPKIENIDPTACMGYNNVVIMCGINDIKHAEIQCEKHVADMYSVLKNKIKQIHNLSPRSNILICRLLPTKDRGLNRKVITFNHLIYRDLLHTCSRVRVVEGFHKFADHRDLLADGLSKTYDRRGAPDLLHLNGFGVRILASLIKNSIFTRLHGGVDKRRHSGRLDGRLFSDASRPVATPAPRRQEVGT